MTSNKVSLAFSSKAAVNTSAAATREGGQLNTVEIEVLDVSSSLDLCSKTNTLYKQGRDFTGTEVWPGSQSLCYAMMEPKNRHIFKDKTVIELGAGVGVCAAVVNAFDIPVKHFVATDGEASCVELATRNITNNTTDLKEDEEKNVNRKPRVEAKVLKWGRKQAQELLHNTAAAATTTSSCKGGFDLLIGGDIIYYRVSFEELVDTIDTLLRPLPMNNDKNDSDDALQHPPAALLVHHVRVADAALLMKEQADKHNMDVFVIDIEHLFCEKIVRDRFWSSMQVLLVLRRSQGESGNGIELFAHLHPEPVKHSNEQGEDDAFRSMLGLDDL